MIVHKCGKSDVASHIKMETTKPRGLVEFAPLNGWNG